MKVIISFLSGGLGNQMFQFATAQALALRHGHQLKVDPSYYRMYRQNRVYELADVFHHRFEKAAPRDLAQVLGWKRFIHQNPTLRRFFRRLPGAGTWVVEPHYHFWPELMKHQHPCLLEGDWQSPRYFQNFSKEITACFSFRQDSFNDGWLLEKVKKSNSVGIHLRRGDYVSNQHTLSYHGICEVDYYRQAIALIRKREKHAKFFVFSDDIGAAREVLTGESDLFFVEPDENRPNHFDMMLMSCCRHNIIANSTFSWWAAWLNQNPTKIVIAPQRWFAAGHLSDRDLIPTDWTRL